MSLVFNVHLYFRDSLVTHVNAPHHSNIYCNWRVILSEAE